MTRRAPAILGNGTNNDSSGARDPAGNGRASAAIGANSAGSSKIPARHDNLREAFIAPSPLFAVPCLSGCQPPVSSPARNDEDPAVLGAARPEPAAGTRRSAYDGLGDLHPNSSKNSSSAAESSRYA